jgi:hypothetical protein
MKKLPLVFLLLAAVCFAPAQKTTIQQTIDVPKPGVYQIQKSDTGKWTFANYIDKSTLCSDVNTQLLAIILELTDQDSVKNEVKYEEDHRLTPEMIYTRRMGIITSGIERLRKGGK